MTDFFEKVKQGVGKGITTVSVKSKEVIETTKIKGQIGTLQEQKKSDLEELGNIVYTMFLKDSFDMERVKEKCETIRGLGSQIKDKEVELRQTHLKAQEALGKPKAIGICDCGAEIYEGVKFCGKCGKKIEEIIKKTDEELSPEEVCPQCGGKLLPEAKFCSKCGAKIG
ncbi:MAG: zinc ribbon domain-containing protein [Proteobacteria bacterium]|nr:zinc ribbon domain-containing protein [Pseudomonadota bacterium]